MQKTEIKEEEILRFAQNDVTFIEVLMKEFFTTNIPIKVIALGLALITWIYVNGEILR